MSASRVSRSAGAAAATTEGATGIGGGSRRRLRRCRRYRRPARGRGLQPVRCDRRAVLRVVPVADLGPRVTVDAAPLLVEPDVLPTTSAVTGERHEDPLRGRRSRGRVPPTLISARMVASPPSNDCRGSYGPHLGRCGWGICGGRQARARRCDTQGRSRPVPARADPGQAHPRRRRPCTRATARRAGDARAAARRRGRHPRA